MSRAVILGLLLAVAAALALRCPELGLRPMHSDEAVDAIKFRDFCEHGPYKYDPNEYHGPTLFYVTLAWTKLTRVPAFLNFDEARFRLVTVLFGVGLILLLPLVADGLGRGATVCAGVLTAISPVMVFYSRYYIHEMLLVFFTFLALAAGWRFTRSRRMGWALLAGAALGLMQSTKETFVLPLAAGAAALGLNMLWMRWAEPLTPSLSPSDGERVVGGRVRGVSAAKYSIVAAVAVWLVVWLLFFSSFFTNAAGLSDSVRTYLPWLGRAAGDSAHTHPWSFYLARLAFFHARGGPVWSEGLILVLAVAGGVAAFRRKEPKDGEAGLLRFLAFYTLTLTLLYSAIRYKTPWCELGFLHGMILLAGAGAMAVFDWAKPRWLKIAVAILLLTGAGQLAAQAWLGATVYCADRGNPCVYAQTSPDLLNLVEELKALAKTSPQGPYMVVKVITPGGDYWPLPWYLRQFDHVGWWAELPPDPFAPVMIVSTKLNARLDEKKTHLMVGMFELRPGVFLELYVQTDLWQAYLASKPGQK